MYTFIQIIKFQSSLAKSAKIWSIQSQIDYEMTYT